MFSLNAHPWMSQTRLIAAFAVIVLLSGLVAFRPSAARAADCDPSDIINQITLSNATPSVATTTTLTAGCTYTLSGGTLYTDSDSSKSGLPELNGHLIIKGNGAVITRQPGDSVPNFRIFSIGTGGRLDLSDVTVERGSLPGVGGAGIANMGGELNLVNSVVSNNSADGGIGGGIINTGTAIIQQSWIAGNTGTIGAGLVNIGGLLTIDSSTISSNRSDFGPGGIYNTSTDDTPGTTNLVNSTVAGNSAVSGAGVLNNSVFNAYNATIADNSSGGLNNQGGSQGSPVTSTLVNTIIGHNVGVDCDSSQTQFGGIVDSGYNLDSDGTCGLSADNHSLPDTDPLFIASGLHDNGGPTQTIALQPGSPALNAGDDTVCAAAPVNGLGQRGVVRPQGAHCDIGAFELLVPTVTPANAVALSTDTTVTLSATVTTDCGASGTYCPEVSESAVTFTITDSHGNTVGTPVNGAVSAGSATAVFNPSGLASGTYTITAVYLGSVGVFGQSQGTSTLTINPGAAAALRLSPGNTSAAIGQIATEVATVRDANGNLVADGTTVNFSVTGSNPTTGSVTTTNGQASFQYSGSLLGTDTLTATAVGGTSPGATATINWTEPVTTAHASLQIINIFTPNVQAMVLTGSNRSRPTGSFTFSTSAVSLSHVQLTSLVASGSNASLFGTARLANGTTVTFRLDASTRGTVRLQLSNGYDSGNLHVMSVRIRP